MPGRDHSGERGEEHEINALTTMKCHPSTEDACLSMRWTITTPENNLVTREYLTCGTKDSCGTLEQEYADTPLNLRKWECNFCQEGSLCNGEGFVNAAKPHGPCWTALVALVAGAAAHLAAGGGGPDAQGLVQIAAPTADR